MAYKKTTVTGYADLVMQLRDFLVAQSWVVDRDELLGNGRVLIAHNGANYVSFRGCVNDYPLTDYPTSYLGYGLAASGLTGYDAALPWDKQPGYWADTSGYGRCAWANTTADFAGECHFFVHPDSVSVVIKDSSDWLPVIAGNIEKCGSFAGGQVVTAMEAPTSYRNQYNAVFYQGGCAVKAQINNDGAAFDGWVGSDSSTGRTLAAGFLRENESAVYYPVWTWEKLKNSPSAFNRLNVLFPIYMYYARSDYTRSLLGTVKHVYLARAGQSNPGDPVTYGGVNYHIFPLRLTDDWSRHALAFEA